MNYDELFEQRSDDIFELWTDPFVPGMSTNEYQEYVEEIFSHLHEHELNLLVTCFLAWGLFSIDDDGIVVNEVSDDMVILMSPSVKRWDIFDFQGEEFVLLDDGEWIPGEGLLRCTPVTHLTLPASGAPIIPFDKDIYVTLTKFKMGKVVDQNRSRQ